MLMALVLVMVLLEVLKAREAVIVASYSTHQPNSFVL
jgi:hypothetical protein